MRYVQPIRGTPRATLVAVTLATFTDLLLYGLVVPVLPGYTEDMGIAQWAIGVLFGAYSVALLVATPYFGALSDRVGRRAPMLYGLLGLAAATVLFAFATNYWMLLGARLLQGVAAAATWTAGLALMADVFPGESRGAALGTAMSGATVGMLIGPPFGGLLFEWGGYRAPFFVAAVIAVVEGLALLLLVKDPSRRANEEESLRALLRDRGIRVASGAAVVAAGAWGLLEPVLPLHLEEDFDLSPGSVGLLFGAATLVYGVSAPLIGALSDRWGSRPVMVLGVVLLAASLPLIGVPDLLAVAVIGLLLVSVAYGLMLTPTLPEMAAAVDRRGGGAYASAYGVYNAAYAAGMMAGPMIGGALVSAIGFAPALLVTAALVLAYLPVLMRREATRSPDPRRSRSEPTA